MTRTDKKSYEEMRNELDEILLKLQSAELDVDEAVKLYERGLKLIGQLKLRLDGADSTIEKLKIDLDKP